MVTGPTGPAGISGPTGPTGPTGPAGTVPYPLVITNDSKLVSPLVVNRTQAATSVSDADTFQVNYLAERATWTNEKGNLRTSNKGSPAEVAIKILGVSAADGGTGDMLQVLDTNGNIQVRVGTQGRFVGNKGMRLVGDTLQVRDATEADESTISQATGGNLTIAPKNHLSVSSKKIQDLATGTAGTDAVNKAQLDAAIAGGGGGGGGLQTRTTATITTASLAANVSEAGTVTLANGYRLLSITTNRPARVRLYTAVGYRNADASRAIGTYPTGDHGLVVEYITASGLLSAVLSPVVDGYDSKATPDGTAAYQITNLDSGAGVVTVSLLWIRTEA